MNENVEVTAIGPSYIGTKIINATPMTLGHYNKHRGWEIPADEDPEKDGYMVQYKDGYLSWSPLQAFEDSYRKTDGLPFGLAIEAMKKGHKVARAGWNGKDMFVFLVAGSKFNVNRAPLNEFYEEGTEITYRPHMDLKTADGSIATWSPSGSDALADDWMIVE